MSDLAVENLANKEQNHANATKKNKWLIFVLTAVIVLFIDLFTKWLAKFYLADLDAINLIPNFIDLKLVFNSGISFGLFDHQQKLYGWLALSVITVAIVVYLLYYIFKHINGLTTIGLLSFGMIIGGAIGNGFERLYYKEVTDFMVFRYFDRVFFVNNFADDVISIGILLIAVKEFLVKKR